MNSPYRLSLILILTCFFLACSNDPELDKKEQLVQLVANLETAIEAKGLDEFFSHVSDDFVSTNRGWTKKDAERILRLRLMRQSSVHLHTAIKRIDWLDGGDAQAEMEVVAAMAGTAFSLDEMPSFRGDMMKFVVTFKRVDGAYLITQSEWHRASPADFVF